MMLYEVRRAAATVADVLRTADQVQHAVPAPAAPVMEAPIEPYVAPIPEPAVESVPAYAPVSSDPSWASHLPNGSTAPAAETQTWS
jgi:hypothetical protein